MSEIHFYIDNCHDLLEDIEKYKKFFPQTYTTIDGIKDVLKQRVNDPVGFVFGIDVSTEWQGKCFGFEVDKVTPETTFFKYLGIWKT